MGNGRKALETIASAHLNISRQEEGIFHEEWKTNVVNEWENFINWKYNRFSTSDEINEEFEYSSKPIDLII